MCLILFALNSHPEYKLVMAANRDEFYDRPTASAGFWQDHPHVLAGRDLALGGTWLGVTKAGRFAAVTNYRDPSFPKGSLSRGELTKNFLIEKIETEDYLSTVERSADKYSGFNLLVGEIGVSTPKLGYFSNRGNGLKILTPGIYGLSNRLLDDAWPKVIKGKSEFESTLDRSSEQLPEALFEILNNNSRPNDADLPDTGIGIERERLVSPIFIESPIYGTRSSTVLLVKNDNTLLFSEKSHHPELPVFSTSLSVI